jgi:hypothetical protein
VLRDPLHAADDLGPGPATVAIQHSHGPDASARSDADDAVAVVLRADDSRDVRAVPVIISQVAVAHAIVATSDVEVVIRADAGVDHGHIDIDDAGAIAGFGRAHVRIDPVYPRLETLDLGANDVVRVDRLDAWILHQARGGAGAHRAREAGERGVVLLVD